MKYFLYGLTILFIGLKLTNYIDWSWVLVLLPLYGGIAFVFGSAIIVFIIGTFLIGLSKILKAFGK
ncbi:MAG: hypothetical protein WC622_16775 [Pedobacter sp.]|jgi:hypothetical protein|uniref:hypothetical protein n=1 Tax=Pedobacter sp. TaxID=1411316 RepID=UPI00356AEA02